MAHILTLQSHVVYGQAGNAAAVFPMQRLGHEVSALNLLQFSNHTGHGAWEGSAISAQELKDIFKGLEKVGIFSKLNCILSGYIASLEQAHVIYDWIRQVKAHHPDVMYCCDPVIGDERPGIYIKSEVAMFLQSHLVPIADWITPNRFELSYLTGKAVMNLQDAIDACSVLFKEKKQGILATSIAAHSDMTGLLLITKKRVFHCETPKYELISTVHGTGDVTTATFISHLLKGDNAVIAMVKTANTLHDLARFSFEHRLTELEIVGCQEVIACPREVYPFIQII